MKQIISICLTVIAVTTIVATLIYTRPDTRAELRQIPVQTVVATGVIQDDIQPTRHITGKLFPSATSTLRFEVSGQVQSRHVEAGQFVDSLTKLVVLDDQDYQDRVVQAKAQLEIEHQTVKRDRTLLALSEKKRLLQQEEVERLNKLGQKSLASKSNYEQALQSLYQQQEDEARLKFNIESAESRIKLESAQLEQSQRNLERTMMRAPFAATVNQVMVEVGDYVTAQTPIIELVKVSELDLQLYIPGDIVAELAEGQVIHVETSNGQKAGKIISLMLAPDPVTNTHKVTIRIPADGLLPGELATAALRGKHYQNAKLVPNSAIMYEDGGAYVFIIKENKIERVAVKPIERYKGMYIIEGIEIDRLIVSKDVSSLADGQEVIVQ